MNYKKEGRTFGVVRVHNGDVAEVLNFQCEYHILTFCNQPILNICIGVFGVKVIGQNPGGDDNQENYGNENRE